MRVNEILDSLGITRDILIYNNLQEVNPNEMKYKHFHVDSNSFDKNINLSPIPIVSKDLSQFLKNNTNQSSETLFQSGLSPELKQSINGTYRIVVHRIQKKFRKEFNSEQLAQRHMSVDITHVSQTNLIQLTNKLDFNKFIHSNEKMTEVVADSGKPNAEQNSPNKSIFVKLNSDNKSSNMISKSIFINRSSKPSQVAAVAVPVEAKPAANPPQNGQSMHTKNAADRFSSISTHEQLYKNINNNAGKHANNANNHFNSQSFYHTSRRQSSKQVDFSSAYKNQASNRIADGKQSSKLCSIL